MMGRKWLCILILAVLTGGAGAQNVSYLDSLPTQTEIEEAFPLGGEDPIDSAARQTAAFSIVSDTILKTARERKADFTPQERLAYDAARFDADARIRESFGWDKLGCGSDADCYRYEEAVIDYQRGDKKKAKAFRRDFQTRLYGNTVMPDNMSGASMSLSDVKVAPTDWIAILVGLALGILAAHPFRALRRGVVTALGSGIVREAGLETFNRRHRIKIGNTKLGTTITSARMDDALINSLNSGGESVVGVGWILWMRWILSVRQGGETEREGLVSFLSRTLLLIPVASAIGVGIMAFALNIVADQALVLLGAIFVLAFGITSIFVNFRAWLGV